MRSKTTKGQDSNRKSIRNIDKNDSAESSSESSKTDSKDAGYIKGFLDFLTDKTKPSSENNIKKRKTDDINLTVTSKIPKMDSKPGTDNHENTEKSAKTKTQVSTTERRTSLRNRNKNLEKLKQHVEEDEPAAFSDSDVDPEWGPEDDDNPKKNNSSFLNQFQKSALLTNKQKSSKTVSKPNTTNKQKSLQTVSKPNSTNKQTVSNQLQKPNSINKSLTTNSPVATGTNTKIITTPNVNSIGLKRPVLQKIDDTPIAPAPEFLIDDDDDKPMELMNGEFVMLKSNIYIDDAPIWQVDSKNVIQRFEPFVENGKTFYKNQNKYAGLTTLSKRNYFKIPVKKRNLTGAEKIVVFMRDQMLAAVTKQFIDKKVEQYSCHKDSFLIYIQTYISQVLDTGFLSVILSEKDEYFYPGIQIIDGVINEFKNKLLSVIEWDKNILTTLETWPIVDKTTILDEEIIKDKKCSGCNESNIISEHFIFKGQPYDIATLKPKVVVVVEIDDIFDENTSKLYFCKKCADKANVFHKIVHIKYTMYDICSKEVKKLKTKEPNVQSKNVLKKIMNDTKWTDEIFLQIRTIWAESDLIERKMETS